jgi:hypothetical protein
MNGKALARPPACARISRRGCSRRNAALGTTAALVLSCVATNASADVFTVTAYAITAGLDDQVNKSSGTPPVETSFGGTSDFLSFSAVAAPGLLEAESSVNTGFAGPDLGSSLNGYAGASASMALDNVVISGPTSGSVMYSVNFTISGSVTLVTIGTPDAQGGVDLLYDGATSLGTLGVVTDINDQTAPTGIFAGIIDPSNITVSGMTPETLVNVGDTISVGFGLFTSAQADSAPGSAADLIVNFSDPFSLPTSGPVFNFFDPLTGDPLTGITANSSDGCIVNNVFMCGSAGPSGSIPELPTWAMMLAGFAGLGFAGWRRGRRRAVVPTGEKIGYDQF